MNSILKTTPKWLLVTAAILGLWLLGHIFTAAERPFAFDARQCDAKNKGPYDGRVLYACAVNAVAEHHKSLVSADARSAFLAEWLHKFEHSAQLNTEEGTLKAITEMVLHVKGRFDFVFTPEAVAQNEVIEKGQLAGIGASVALPRAGAEQSLSQMKLPEHASPQLIAMLKMKKSPAAVISQSNPLLIIADPEVGTPAHTGGMKKGDIIFAVDDREVYGKTLDAVIGQIRGEPGSALKVTIIRGGEKKELSLVRAMVELHTTSQKRIGNVGYLRIEHFESMRVIDDVHKSLDNLCNTASSTAVESADACQSEAMIVDLRGNPGGRFDAVVVISEFFLDKGNISSVMLRDGDQIVRTDFTLSVNSLDVKEGDKSTAHQRNFGLHFPMDRKFVVLVDQYSASGAEALATILQQQRHAVVVGMQTRGKGVGQCPVSLPFGYEANFICMEYWAGGKAVDWLGVTPDVVVTQQSGTTQDLQLDMALRIATGEEVVKADPALQSEHDRQIVAERKNAYAREVEDTLKRFFN
ncbi:MAG: PDZ domain-containing protein [Candidatus Melainabacteria bacterium]|nr:PDZ domain-containing protein [Candidatus Melainabacteria bacterium]